MGRKGSWISAIKRVFSPQSKAKPSNDSKNESTQEKKKKGLGKLRRGQTNSFIPLFRGPSSVEKIFLDYERTQQNLASTPPTPPVLPRLPPSVPPPGTSPSVSSPRVSPPRGTSPRDSPFKLPSPRVASAKASCPSTSYRPEERASTPEPTQKNLHASATKIQAVFRGYMARRSFRALKGLVRLQSVVRGQHVRRQTMNAMKQMQLLVRVQSQVQSWRIQILENQAQHQVQSKNEKELESTLGKWSIASETRNHEGWDDSILSKEESDARLLRKADAMIKRERAMTYGNSQQILKANPKSSQAALLNFRSGGFPRWWNWFQQPTEDTAASETVKNFLRRPPTPQSEQKPTPRFSSVRDKHQQVGNDNMDALTPKSTRSTMQMPTRPTAIPGRTPPANSPSFVRHSRPRASEAASPLNLPIKDDDSLMSCPAFSFPRYMAPTVSAIAKVRASSNPRERFPGTPSSESQRRMSFPLSQGVGSSNGQEGSLFSTRHMTSRRAFEKKHTLQSIDSMSVDSTVSMPAGVGRKPFNRFV